jgi:glutaredoxin
MPNAFVSEKSFKSEKPFEFAFKPNPRMVCVEFYSKDECCLCDDAKAVLMKVQREIPFDFHEIKIQDDENLKNEYGTKIPVVFINGLMAFKYHVYELELKDKLKRAGAPG